MPAWTWRSSVVNFSRGIRRDFYLNLMLNLICIQMHTSTIIHFARARAHGSAARAPGMFSSSNQTNGHICHTSNTLTFSSLLRAHRESSSLNLITAQLQELTVYNTCKLLIFLNAKLIFWKHIHRALKPE